MRKIIIPTLLLSPVLMGGLFLSFTLSAAEELPSAAATAANGSSSAEILARELLRQQIEERAKELERVNQELAITQKNLSETQSERRSLQKELNTLQYSTNQLKLNLKADGISLQKLNLEIQSLAFDIEDIEASVKDKRGAMVEIFRELQRNDQTNFLIVFLRNNSLAASVQEVQTLENLNYQLTTDITDLRTLQGDLKKKVDELGDKKVKTDLHRKNLENRRVILQDQTNERQNLLGKSKNKESLYEQQLDELRKLQQEIAEEIESLDAELRTKIDPSLLPTARPGVLGSPVEGALLITQKYGSTKFAQSAYPGKWHNGIDLKASLGAPIFAAEEGRVIAVGDSDAYRGCYRAAYGKFIAVNHDNNLTTLYAHLSRQVVKVGEEVVRGQLIGYAGRTGYATGPHLHFTVFAQPTFYVGPSRVCGPMPFGGDLNPERYL